MALLYGSYTLLFRQPVVLPVKHIETHEDYVEALSFYRRIKVLEEDITLGLSQLSRMKKKKETLLNVLHQRFDPGELSYKKFASVTLEVEKLLYLNIRSVLNRLNVFDEARLCQHDEVQILNTSPEAFSGKNQGIQRLSFLCKKCITHQ